MYIIYKIIIMTNVDSDPLEEFYKDLYNNNNNSNLYNTFRQIKKEKQILKKRNQLRQLCEMIKINHKNFIDKILDLQKERSIVIILNFIKSINLISKRLSEINLKHNIITGETNQKDKIKYIEEFQNDKIRIIILSIQLSVGISLHDLNGLYPRCSFISLSDNLVDIKQSLGRICRLNTKSFVEQYFLIVKDSIEEEILKNYYRKDENMTILLDG